MGTGTLETLTERVSLEIPGIELRRAVQNDGLELRLSVCSAFYLSEGELIAMPPEALRAIRGRLTEGIRQILGKIERGLPLIREAVNRPGTMCDGFKR